MAEDTITLYELAKKAGVTYQALRILAATGSLKVTETVKTVKVVGVTRQEAERYLKGRAERQAAKASKSS